MSREETITILNKQLNPINEKIEILKELSVKYDNRIDHDKIMMKKLLLKGLYSNCIHYIENIPDDKKITKLLKKISKQLISAQQLIEIYNK